MFSTETIIPSYRMFSAVTIPSYRMFSAETIPSYRMFSTETLPSYEMFSSETIPSYGMFSSETIQYNLQSRAFSSLSPDSVGLSQNTAFHSSTAVNESVFLISASSSDDLMQFIRR